MLMRLTGVAAGLALLCAVDGTNAYLGRRQPSAAALLHHRSEDGLPYTSVFSRDQKKDTGTMVDELWSQVEKNKKVEYASTRKVQPRPQQIDTSDPRRMKNHQPATADERKAENLKFPDGFVYGIANAAAQVEGAVKADGRGPSIWDSFAHLTDGMKDQSTFDVATNFRYLYKEDIARVRQMGVQLFSFSFSWPRVIPMGYGEASQEGLQFYKDVIGEIKQNNMEPMATLFHWDLPLQLEIHYRGMISDHFVSDFVRYATLMFKTYGKSGIKKWVTFNEPEVWCIQRYPLTAPHVHGETESDDSFRWKCNSVFVHAHARTYRVFKKMQANGEIDKDAQIGVKHAGSMPRPYNMDSKSDKQVAERMADFYIGSFAEPIAKGDYPENVKNEIPKDWLPPLSQEDKEMIKGSVDFFATDFYCGGLAKTTTQMGGLRGCIGNRMHPRWPTCNDDVGAYPDGTPIGQMSDVTTPWLNNTAPLLRYHIKALNSYYPSRGGIYISEFGWAERGEQNKTNIHDIQHDKGRTKYYRDYIVQMLLSIHEDKMPLKGMIVWSATNNLEWEVGKAPRFGVQSVDYKTQKRTYLGSFFTIRDLMRKHGVIGGGSSGNGNSNNSN